jgi:hypothetical protein
MGGETQGKFRSASRTSSSVRRSDCRELMANDPGIPGGRFSPLGWNITANCGRNVCPPASAWGSGAKRSDASAPSMLRACRQRSRDARRQIVVTWAERPSRLCVLMNPILPGAIQRTCRRNLKNHSLAGPDLSARARAELGNHRGRSSRERTRQLTNRRMRTFIATPSARNVNKTEDPP